MLVLLAQTVSHLKQTGAQDVLSVNIRASGWTILN